MGHSFQIRCLFHCLDCRSYRRRELRVSRHFESTESYHFGQKTSQTSDLQCIQDRRSSLDAQHGTNCLFWQCSRPSFLGVNFWSYSCSIEAFFTTALPFDCIHLSRSLPQCFARAQSHLLRTFASCGNFQSTHRGLCVINFEVFYKQCCRRSLNLRPYQRLRKLNPVSAVLNHFCLFSYL